ncbi:MAG: sialate O-acetylesterase [Terrimicrobiaceae bacterium]
MKPTFTNIRSRRCHFNLRLMILFALSVWMGCNASAKETLRVAGIFGNDMVLQREAEVPVWGWAEAGQSIKVSFSGQTKETQADAAGKWMVRLDAMPASDSGRTMRISGGGTSVTFANILVGEVWVLSGQSNMGMRISDCSDNDAAARAKYPWLRYFSEGWPFGTEQQPNLESYRAKPAADVPEHSTWASATPKNAGNCSAAGFYFAEALHRAIGVPIGLIQASVGSTWGECWVSKEMRDANPALSYIGTEFWTKPLKNPWFVDKYIMYHAMVAPLQPYGIRGVLWYQGEGNTDPSVGHYKDLLTGLIKGWRKEWNQGDFPFFIVQLPKYGAAKDPWHSWEQLREAQLQVSREVPNTGLAITIDTGGTDIHPTDKQPVGERLARLARALVYNDAIESTGPIYTDYTADETGVKLHFSGVGNGLQATGGAPRTFEVAGAEEVFVPAQATIMDRNTVRLTCPQVPRIHHVRYGWDWNPDCNLFSSEMLPASPFRAKMKTVTGTISANPWTDVIIPAGQKYGSTTVTYSATGAAQAQVYVSVNGTENSNCFSQGTSGKATASFIQDGVVYDFNLYEGTNRAKLLATVRVYGREYAYNVGVDYHATGADFFSSSFLVDYHLPSVRSAVQAQLQSMANRGATLISTRLWLFTTTPGPMNTMKCNWHFPPSTQELATLRQYAQDVAALQAADGHRLTLDVVLLQQSASDYSQGTPSSTLGQENLAPRDFLNKWVASYQGVIDAVSDVARPDGVKVAGRVYLSGEVMIGAKANEDWFFTNVYPGFVSYAKGKGVTPTTYFNACTPEAEILDNRFVDGANPLLSGHRSMYWIYRSLRFFKDNGLYIPDRIDFSTYPQKASASYTTLVQRIFDDADATLPSLGARKWYAVAETNYFTNQATRQELGNAFMAQRSVNNRVSQVNFWTTPDAGGPGVHIGFPFAIEDYLPPVTLAAPRTMRTK